ncbi:Ninja-family protein 3 [Apostasia shenzhenica]|uniref:Ninja-family protein n=1 Tax=Apostasia shenzhenica TaxID=1088818 RepID=A0A2I0A2J1_9ASPA|nr:Ninja-family protein 3 [Apostasia shenzhenica]
MEAGAREGEVDQVLSATARDFLRRFSGGLSVDEAEEAGGGNSDEIELGLSLGGCFSSHGRDDNGLVCTSSIPEVVPHEFLPAVPLARSRSMPSETEEELRRRKELQNLKKMEVKRKREDKRISKRTGERFGEDIEVGSITKTRRFELENSSSSWIYPGGGQAEGVAPSGLPRWIAGAALPSLSIKTFSPASQASVASQGSCSSEGSEFESRSGQGFEACETGRCASNRITVEDQNYHMSSLPSSSSSLPNRISSSNGVLNNSSSSNNPWKKNAGRISNGQGETGKMMMEEMPCVSTKGIGPNGRRIEGFLYRYKKGEEVRIVCVCHGKFHSPAEFVKHAGGGDVAHPLRHIVVNPNPASLL